MIIGTAGHVDHGKTALVKAITGIDADRLAEEKRRGITIDLGYAYTDALGFIDVPGHERFVHTMLAGASGIDAALLVVALPEGVRPQTIEHVQILNLLGIERGVVALTKADLAPERIDDVTLEVQALLAGSPLADVPIVPVSAFSSRGIADLLAELQALGQRPRRTDGYPRLAVDRAFTLSGAGLIVTGTLVAGRIAVEDRLMLSPSGLEVRVRGLHAQNQPADHAVAGQRVALNLTGARLSKDLVARGDWVLHPDIHGATDRFDARIRLLPEEAKALRQDVPVHLHLGAAHTIARLAALEPERLEPGASALVRLTLARPMGALAGDRIVLRDAAATRTLGGGVLIDPYPPKRGRRTSDRLHQLTALEAADAATALSGVLAGPPGWVDSAVFLRARNVKTSDAPALLAAAGAEAVGPLLIAAGAAARLRRSLIDILAVHHRVAADQPGLQAERLRLQLPDRIPIPGFRALLDGLLRDGTLAQDGPWLRLAAHRLTLSPQEERLWQATRQKIAADRFRPPRTRDLAEALGVQDGQVRTTLKRMQRLGRVVEIAPDHFFLRETVAEMAHIAAQAAGSDGQLTAAGFRDRLDNGRKVAIQILEFFDKAGITVRSGDARRVRPERLGAFGDL